MAMESYPLPKMTPMATTDATTMASKNHEEGWKTTFRLNINQPKGRHGVKLCNNSKNFGYKNIRRHSIFSILPVQQRTPRGQ